MLKFIFVLILCSFALARPTEDGVAFADSDGDGDDEAAVADGDGAVARVQCTGDAGNLDSSDQNKIDRFIGLIRRKRNLRWAIGFIRNRMKSPRSFIRKLLKKALGAYLQNPKADDYDESKELIPTKNISGKTLFLLKIIGETKTVVGYLWKFGYIQKMLNITAKAADEFEGDIPPCAITNAIMEFQEWNQLEISGKLTKETRELMAKNRCGNPDVECDTEECLAAMEGEEGEHLRKRRFAIKRKGWNGAAGVSKVNLKYHFDRYLNIEAAKKAKRTPLTPEQIRAQVEKGMASWAQYADITFTETANKADADVSIRFGEYDHPLSGKTAKNPFDGPWGVLAHMYYPKKGEMHFDESENFTEAESGAGVNLFYVAAHEMGHGLGIKHSSVRASLMAPYYQGYRTPMLTEDDIEAIQKLYGEGTGTVVPLPIVAEDDD